MRFDSKGESKMYDFLKNLERAGEISNIRTQKTVELLPDIRYRADFVAYDHTLKEDVYFEFKGFETDIWKIKKKIWAYCGPCLLKVYKERRGEMVLHETIIPTIKRP